MTLPSPKRRPVDVSCLERFAAKVKLRTSIDLPARKQTISLPREAFAPVIQAEVGSLAPLLVYRYRLLVPLAHVILEAAGRFHQFTVATGEDVDTIRDALIRHFGGVTVLHRPPAQAFGVGARDPSNVAETLEQNEHVAFEVYAAPIQESDDYFRALRHELEQAIQEGVILIERQQVTLL